MKVMVVMAAMVVLMAPAETYGAKERIFLDPTFSKREVVHVKAGVSFALLALPELKEVITDERFEIRLAPSDNLIESIRKMDEQMKLERPPEFYQKLQGSGDENSGAETVGYIRDEKIILCVFLDKGIFDSKFWPLLYAVVVHEAAHWVDVRNGILCLMRKEEPLPTDRASKEIRACRRTFDAISQVLAEPKSSVLKEIMGDRYEVFQKRMLILAKQEEKKASIWETLKAGEAKATK